MTINFVGNYQAGYVGELGDANHLTRELETLGHKVQKVPQDIWREYVRGERNPDWKSKLPIKSDINIICKWPHFYDGSFISQLRIASGAPVFYWVWDYMDDMGIPDWHKNMIREADLYLTNEYGIKQNYLKLMLDKLYYFPFDVADGSISTFDREDLIYDVAFFGSWIGQGNRQVWLSEINKTNPITVFSWNYKDWPKEFDAHPAVYGEEFNKMISQTGICLGFSVEPNCWGYWSNRTGKTMLAGGFLLQQYAPGMELFLRDGVEYFSSIEEAREKIDHYSIANDEREEIAQKGFHIAQDRMSSKARVKDLTILIERYLVNGKQWNY